MKHNWISHPHQYDEAGPSTLEQYERTQKNKFGKTLIGIAVLIVVGFVFWEVGPVSHRETVNHAAVHAPAKAPPSPAISSN